jgi:hypothetical protein
LSALNAGRYADSTIRVAGQGQVGVSRRAIVYGCHAIAMADMVLRHRAVLARYMPQDGFALDLQQHPDFTFRQRHELVGCQSQETALARAANENSQQD